MDWAKHGVKIVHSDDLDLNTLQTPGMTRAAAITHARAEASKLLAGTMLVQPDAKTGPHHHGEARMQLAKLWLCETDRIRLWSIWICALRSPPVWGMAACRFTLTAEYLIAPQFGVV